MRYIPIIFAVLLAALAGLSGVSKIMLQPQEVAFFGQYGFTNPLLMAFGGLQVLGALLMLIPRFRGPGAIVVAATFLASLVLLLIEGNLGMAAVTAVVLIMLTYVIVDHRNVSHAEPE